MLSFFDSLVFNFLQKIKSEAEGKKSIAFYNNQNREYERLQPFYRGLACLLGIEEGLSVSQEERKNFHELYPERLTKTLRMLYEHRAIILKSMKWLKEIFAEAGKGLSEEIEVYQETTDLMHEVYLLSVKNDIKYKDSNLQVVKEKCGNLYYKEKEILNSFYVKAKKMYIEQQSFEQASN